MQRARDSRRGSQVIEASLSLMLFLWVTLGLFDFGFVLFIEQTLTHQVRSAARYAVAHADRNNADLFPIVQRIAVCGSDRSCTGAWGFVPSDVVVARRDAGTRDGRIAVTLPGVSYLPLAPAAPVLRGRAISVSLGIENTTPLPGGL